MANQRLFFLSLIGMHIARRMRRSLVPRYYFHMHLQRLKELARHLA